MAGGSGDPLWMDVDRPEETNTIVSGLNASTRYLFRVRASVQGLGDWSNTVEEATLGNGKRLAWAWGRVTACASFSSPTTWS